MIILSGCKDNVANNAGVHLPDLSFTKFCVALCNTYQIERKAPDKIINLKLKSFVLIPGVHNLLKRRHKVIENGEKIIIIIIMVVILIYLIAKCYQKGTGNLCTNLI